MLEAFFVFVYFIINKKKQIEYKKIRKASVIFIIIIIIILREQAVNEYSASLKGTRYVPKSTANDSQFPYALKLHCKKKTVGLP